MNYTAIETWLVSTVPGIIILGAAGSVLGTMTLWLTIKIIKSLFIFILKQSDSLLSRITINLLLTYTRAYINAKEMITTLSNKNSELPITLLYIKITRQKYYFSTICTVSLFISILLFSFQGTEYPKLTISFVAITFALLHDSIIYSVYLKMIERNYIGAHESEIKNKKLSKKEILLESKNIINNWSGKKSRNGL